MRWCLSMGCVSQPLQLFQDILPECVRLTVMDVLQPKGLLFRGGSGDEIVSKQPERVTHFLLVYL